jgi:nucleotide-binding universal stress UspA family protein
MSTTVIAGIDRLDGGRDGTASGWLLRHAPCPVLLVPRPDEAVAEIQAASAVT